MQQTGENVRHETNHPYLRSRSRPPQNQEWQGTVYFPASGEQQAFGSLLELIRTVEQHVPMQRQDSCGDAEEK